MIDEARRFEIEKRNAEREIKYRVLQEMGMQVVHTNNAEPEPPLKRYR